MQVASTLIVTIACQLVSSRTILQSTTTFGGAGSGSQAGTGTSTGTSIGTGSESAALSNRPSIFPTPAQAQAGTGSASAPAIGPVLGPSESPAGPPITLLGGPACSVQLTAASADAAAPTASSADSYSYDGEDAAICIVVLEGASTSLCRSGTSQAGFEYIQTNDPACLWPAPFECTTAAISLDTTLEQCSTDTERTVQRYARQGAFDAALEHNKEVIEAAISTSGSSSISSAGMTTTTSTGGVGGTSSASTGPPGSGLGSSASTSSSSGLDLSGSTISMPVLGSSNVGLATYP